MTLRTLLACLAMAIALPLQAATEVLPLNYRSADELLPIVRATLGADGKVSAYGNQLIINASPDKIGEVRDLLAQLDTAPRRLLISVDTARMRNRRDCLTTVTMPGLTAITASPASRSIG